MIPLVLGLLPAGFYVGEFRCPGCGNHFERLESRPQSRRRSREPRHCGWCGIRIGTPKSAAVDAEKERAAAVLAEQAAEATRHRVADVQGGAADASIEAANIASRAHDGS
jgi:hypothetical protein